MDKKNIKIIRYFFVAFLWPLIFVINGQAQTLNNKEQLQIPRFESAPCAVEIPEGVRAECGNLFVKENRQKTESRPIRLSIIIIKSTSANPAPDPIFYTGGGPGASSLGRARGAKNLVPYTQNRDFIIFEQRGTHFAEPNLQCPEVNTAHHQRAEQNLNAKKSRQTELAAVKACRARLVGEGVDLAAYDSAASAADMEDLRRVLGIEKWNLYGVSYSTRLMLNYLREYPQNVRSVILDSVLPTAVNYDETSVDSVINSLKILFESCAREAKCAAAYPNLENDFYTLLKRADQQPFVINAVKEGKTYPIQINGAGVADFVYNLLEDTGALPLIPSIIDALYRGNDESLRRFAENQITGEGFIWGMRYSVWCREEMPFQNRRLIEAQVTKYPALKGFRIQGSFPDICKAWNVPPVSKIENEPVKSPIPALIFSGQFDPDTPPAWGKLVSSWFPNSFFYEVKATSHGVLFGNRCAIVEVAASFLDNPKVKPKDACLAEIPSLNFK